MAASSKNEPKRDKKEMAHEQSSSGAAASADEATTSKPESNDSQKSAESQSEKGSHAIIDGVKKAGSTAANAVMDNLKTAGHSTADSFRADVEDFKEFYHKEVDGAKEIGHDIAHPHLIKEAAERKAKEEAEKAKHLGHEIAHPHLIVDHVKDSVHHTEEAVSDSIEALEEFTHGPIDKEKLPWPLKIFAILCILGGLVTIWPMVTTAIDWADMLNGTAEIQLGTPSLVVMILQVINYALLILSFVFLGIRLLRNRRRFAAITMNFIAILVILGIAFSIMLRGVSWYLILYGVVFVIIVALESYVDPSLSEERRKHRELRDRRLKKEADEGTIGLNIKGKGYITLNFFNLFWIFVVCSILGLIIETIFHIIVFGHYQDRAGMLYGPFSPIYGFGAVLMTIFLNRFHDSNIIVIFLVSAVIGGAFEYFVSWFMQYAFGAVAWNYTGMWLSIGGRTCGLFMAMWGVLGVIWIKILLPIMLRLVNLIPWNWRYTITTIAAVAMAVDGLMTLMALDCWYERLSGDPVTTPIQHFFAQYYDNSFMADRFQSMTINPDEALRSHQ